MTINSPVSPSHNGRDSSCATICPALNRTCAEAWCSPRHAFGSGRAVHRLGGVGLACHKRCWVPSAAVACTASLHLPPNTGPSGSVFPYRSKCPFTCPHQEPPVCGQSYLACLSVKACYGCNSSWIQWHCITFIKT